MRRLVNERLLAMLSACFGGLALLLAGIGVYGVVTYSVTQRTAELGLRIALGASRAGLLWLVVRGTLTLIVIAVVLGVTAAFMTSSLLSSFLFGIQPAEPWVYSATMALLIAHRVAGDHRHRRSARCASIRSRRSGGTNPGVPRRPETLRLTESR